VMAVAPGHASDPGLVEWSRFSEVLPHVEAVVCHSGLTTVVEALYFGKPVVFLEYTPADRVIGQRITELGIGRVLSAEGLTPSHLRAATYGLAADSSVRRQIAAVRTEMLAEGGPERAAEAIGTWLTASQLVNER
jgi:UDP:flavonoid glycosyltransferase YjiC (YdhE family)